MIGKILIELREQRNLQQKDVAKALGISSQRYNHYETGKRYPDFDVLKSISIFYNVSIDRLLGHNSNKYLTDEEKYLVDVYNNSSVSNRKTIRALIEAIDTTLRKDEQ